MNQTQKMALFHFLMVNTDLDLGHISLYFDLYVACSMFPFHKLDLFLSNLFIDNGQGLVSIIFEAHNFFRPFPTKIILITYNFIFTDGP